MTTIDHKAEAEKLLSDAGEDIGVEEFAHADLKIKAAHVEATLYLAEQQRVANLIALGQVVAGDGSRPFRHLVMRAVNEYDVGPVPDIARALGLEGAEG